ncbi:MAG TPA: hypothetical protein VII49_03975 [Rhizomicrobium sp.]
MERRQPKVIAKHGEKMITVTVRFWTDGIASDKGSIRKRHGWAAGAVALDRNDSHGITGGPSIPFGSLMDMGSAIEKALLKGRVMLHRSKRMKKYVES